MEIDEIRGHVDSICSLRNKICYVGCVAIVLPWLVGVEVPLSLNYKILTSVIGVIIIAGLLIVCRNITPEVAKLKRRRNAQFWWLRVTWVLLAFWWGYSVAVVTVSSISALILLTAFVAFLYYSVTRINNRIIGHYEDILL